MIVRVRAPPACAERCQRSVSVGVGEGVTGCAHLQESVCSEHVRDACGCPAWRAACPRVPGCPGGPAAPMCAGVSQRAPARPAPAARIPRERRLVPAVKGFHPCNSLLHSLFKLYNFCLIVMAYFKITRNQSQEVDTRSFIASLR